MREIFLTVFVGAICIACHAQYLAAFNDNQEQFWVFEAGMFSQLEDSKVQDFQVGGTLMAYLDPASNFKVYQYGEVKTLLEVAQVEFTATDYLLGYSLIDTLYVYDQDKIKKLSTDCEEYLVRDSILLWQTRSEETLYAYYNGKTIKIAEGLTDFKFEPTMAGDNLFAFVNSLTKEFTVFYMGEIFVLDSYAEEMHYQAGADILAFTDVPDQTFNVFYKGEIIELDLYQPQSFQVGDQILAYLDNQEDLKFFENGQVKNITSEPEFYEMKDHILVFEDQGSFKTVCNGQTYIIEQFIPRPYYIDENTLAYLEHNEFVKIFQYCSHITAESVDVITFKMVRDIIVYSESDDEVKVYFNGQIYEHVDSN